MTRKLDVKRVYPAEMLARYRYRVRILEVPDRTYLSRCSFAPSQGKDTCDDYAVDHTERDPNIGAVKYYVFRSQFDVQRFEDDSFVENNGRGGIAYGRCR